MMIFIKVLQRFFSFFLFILGIALVAVAITNYFISPIHTLFQDPVKANFAYLFRLILAGVVAATGLFGLIRGRGFIHLMFAFASLAYGVILYFSIEWYIAAGVMGLSAIAIFLNFIASFKKLPG